MSIGSAGAVLARRDASDSDSRGRRAVDAVAVLLHGARRASTGATPRPRIRLRPRAWRGLAIAVALMVGSACAQADSDATAAEYRIKAAFLLKFLDFVDWPPGAIDHADAPFLIGVLGSRNLGDALDQAAAGRRVNGHPVHVRTLARDDAAAGLQMLFVGRAESGRVAAIATTTNGQPLLLVTESDSALPQGAAINFVVVDDKVRFDVSLRAADRAGLKISARLLAVARTVLPNTP
jgi:hypothetical protein